MKFLPRYDVLGTPLGGKGYVANLPTFGQLLIFFGAKCRARPKLPRLCSPAPHLWKIAHFVAHANFLGTPPPSPMLVKPICPLVGKCLFSPYCELFGDPPCGTSM